MNSYGLTYKTTEKRSRGKHNYTRLAKRPKYKWDKTYFGMITSDNICIFTIYTSTVVNYGREETYAVYVASSNSNKPVGCAVA